MTRTSLLTIGMKFPLTETARKLHVRVLFIITNILLIFGWGKIHFQLICAYENINSGLIPFSCDILLLQL